MAPCGGNIVTPKMIKKGEIHIGDKIMLEEASAPASEASLAVSPADTVSGAVSSATAAEIPAASVAASENAVEVQTRTAPGMIPGVQSTPGTQMQGSQGMQSAQMQGMQGMPNTQGMQNTMTNDNGVTRWQTATPQQVRQMAQQPQQMAQQPQQMAQQPQFPLNFNGMTDYVNSLAAAGSQSPSFNVPSHPMVPPEYEQTIDYDSIQYMNGFLRTQIGRYVRVEQLIGSGNTEERFGFLVGVGNNYLLLQDISDGNILVVDFYSIKFVYIYFGEPVFPNIPLGPAV